MTGKDENTIEYIYDQPSLPGVCARWDEQGQRGFLRLARWWSEFRSHPEWSQEVEDKVSNYIPYPAGYYNRLPEPYWATVKAARLGVKDLRGLLGEFYDPRGAERGSYEPMTHLRPGQSIISSFSFANNKRRLEIVAPSNIAAWDGESTVQLDNVKARILFERGGYKTWRVSVVLTPCPGQSVVLSNISLSTNWGDVVFARGGIYIVNGKRPTA